MPVVVWFHENQLTFPTTPNQRTEVWPAWTNWRSALAGDAVVFNSEHHRREVLDAVPRLLSRSPDHGHEHRYLDLVERSRVLPVGVNSATLAAAPRPGGGEVPVIVWNHRWDHDKGPAAFVASLARLAADDVPFQVALLGDDRHFLGDARADALRRLGDRVVCSGHLDPDEYRAALLEGDLVVSTALHEFFGVSVVEAVAAGCLPVLPNRLSYPELMGPVGAGFLYDEVRPTRRLRSMLADLEPWAAHRDALRAEMVRFDWSHVGPAYDALVEDLAG